MSGMVMAVIVRFWKLRVISAPTIIAAVAAPASASRCFRSKAALDALHAMEDHYQQNKLQLLLEPRDSPPIESQLRNHGDGISRDVDGHGRMMMMGGGGDNGVRLVLYNYPSFSGAFAALFAHLYHTHLRLPFLVLPFSSVDPLRVDDLKLDTIHTCYLLDLIGPNDFAFQLSQFLPKVIAFDHRKSAAARISPSLRCQDNLEFHIDTEMISAHAVYAYFSQKLSSYSQSVLLGSPLRLLNDEDESRLSSILQYTEDLGLRRWSLPNIKAFNVGLQAERSKLNCITNPYIFEQLLNLDLDNIIAKGNSFATYRQDAAKQLLNKTFKIQLGRGSYGECLGIRVDGNSNLSYEVGEELSKMSDAAGLRPIGAAVFLQRGHIKVCLRSTDSRIDTSEIAKAYGGGGKPCSSSFVIRMDEYNQWVHTNSS